MKQLPLLADEEFESWSFNFVASQLKVSDATVRNWVKTGYLRVDHNNLITRASVDHFKEEVAGSEKLIRRANKSHYDEHNHEGLASSIASRINAANATPVGEELSTVYENSLSNSHKNKEGIYYTPPEIAARFFQGLGLDLETATFCDPCCGTGNFLLAALSAGFKPWNIHGYDTDSTALSIAARRIEETSGHRSSNLLNSDFLEDVTLCSNGALQQYDVIFTNPPWGKKIDKEDKERFGTALRAGKSLDTAALFYFACSRVVKPSGYLGLLLPDAFFNINTFGDARKHLLKQTVISLFDFGKPFKGLVTKALGFVANVAHPSPQHLTHCYLTGDAYERRQLSFSTNPSNIINISCRQEGEAIIERIYSYPHITLFGNARWGLGIVTGNNNKFCATDQKPGYIPVCRGSDIHADKVAAPTCFIPSDLSQYQQVAPKGLYEAKEKLLYRFISSDLVFFCDDEQRYCLNSVNLVIINNSFPLNTRQVAKLLNSKIINWLFRNLFMTHKVLRSDLEKLPLFHEFVLSTPNFTEGDLHDYLGIEEVNGTFRIKK
jgi:site-specific DNA-methyltransferase (adenine-specific)